MLIWVCALHCEAKPIIDFYRLKKSHDDRAYDLYRGENMICIISGTGKLASAAATAWIAARQDQAASIAWINLGIAGAAEQDIGSIFLLNQVIDADNGQRYYPVAIEKSALPGHAGITLSLPSEDYQENFLFDMEASGFLQSALRFSSAELTQCIKIVSDNRKYKTGKNRQQVSDLIQHHIQLIDRQAMQLIELNHQIASLEITPNAWQQLTEMAHFSQTQKNRLRVLLRYLLNRKYNPEGLMQQLGSCSSAKAIIGALEQLSHGDSRQL